MKGGGGGGFSLSVGFHFVFQIDGFSFKVDFYFLKKGDSVSTYLYLFEMNSVSVEIRQILGLLSKETLVIMHDRGKEGMIYEFSISLYIFWSGVHLNSLHQKIVIWISIHITIHHNTSLLWNKGLTSKLSNENYWLEYG